jgi:O-antigen/teichoic acid export membrane protein|tara:strand:- start:144 stop:1469 length:1326 start_codon:yes stop_codon:yes gene_type:complete
MVNKIKSFFQDIDTVRGLQIFQLLRFSFLILIRILLAKTDLTVAEIGTYDALLMIGGTFTFFWISGLLDGLLAAFPKVNEERKRVFLFNVFLLFQVLAFIISGLLFFNQENLTQLFTSYEGEVLPYFNWMCLFWAINIPTYLVEYIYVLKKNPKGIISFGLYAFGGQLLVIILPLWLGFSFEYSFIGLIGLAISKYIWLLNTLRINTKTSIDFSAIRPYLILAFPLILYFFIGSIMNYVDKVLVTKFFGIDGLAIYESGAKELPLVSALVGAIASALIADIAMNLEHGLEQLKTRTRKIMPLLFGVSGICMLISPTIFPIVFNPEFKDSALIFNIYLLILTSRILLPQTILIGLNETKIILYTSIVEIFFNLLFSIIFLKYYGMAGIAFASVIAFMIERIILIIYNRRKHNIRLSQYCDVRSYGIYSIILIGSFLISYFYI